MKLNTYEVVPDKYTGIIDRPAGTYWYNNGLLHRIEGPAVEWKDGSRSWFVKGVAHRTDGPAWEGADGSRSWYVEGKLHRTDGPAKEWDKRLSRSYWLISYNLGIGNTIILLLQ